VPEETSTKQLQEPVELNRLKLNQAAKLALKEAGADPDPQYLYSLQLAMWVLQNHPQSVPDPASQFGPELEETGWAMFGWDPLKAQTILLDVPENASDKSAVTQAAETLVAPVRESEGLAVNLGAKLASQMWFNLQGSVPAMRVATGP
jgi:hypothetical protein